MKKIMMVMVMCLMLVGCSKQTALDITKENYKEYGYKYSRVELEKMMKDRDENKNNYTYSDLNEALEFLVSVEYGIDLEKETSGLLDD